MTFCSLWLLDSLIQLSQLKWTLEMEMISISFLRFTNKSIPTNQRLACYFWDTCSYGILSQRFYEGCVLISSKVNVLVIFRLSGYIAFYHIIRLHKNKLLKFFIVIIFGLYYVKEKSIHLQYLIFEIPHVHFSVSIVSK